jgi:hypothetical protein
VYTGVDINPELLKLARAKYPCVRFEQRDIGQDSGNEQFEYVLISRIFNNRISDNDRVMRSVLRRCFRSRNARPGFQRDPYLREFPESEMYYASPDDVSVLHDRPQPHGSQAAHSYLWSLRARGWCQPSRVPAQPWRWAAKFAPRHSGEKTE